MGEKCRINGCKYFASRNWDICPIHNKQGDISRYDREEFINETSPGFVYFVLAVGLELVKVGKTRHPNKRLAGMLTDCPVEIIPLAIVAVVNPDKMEEALHARLDQDRVRGEWFTLSDHIVTAVERARNEGEDGLVDHFKFLTKEIT